MYGLFIVDLVFDDDDDDDDDFDNHDYHDYHDDDGLSK